MLRILLCCSAALGYVVFSEILNSKEVMVPQDRDRLFFFAFLISSKPIDQKAEGFKFPAWYEKINQRLASIRGTAFMDIKKFMLPDDHYDVTHYRAKRREWRMRGNEVDESSGEKFEDQHCYMFSAAGLSWPPDYKTLPADLHDRIDYLSRRQK